MCQNCFCDKFTPGPWMVPHLGVHEAEVTGNGLLVLVLNRDGRPRENLIANTNLIAAAPLMYKALEAVVMGTEKREVGSGMRYLSAQRTALAIAEGRKVYSAA